MRVGDILVRDVVVEIEEVELFIIVAVELRAQELDDLKVVTLPDLRGDVVEEFVDGERLLS